MKIQGKLCDARIYNSHTELDNVALYINYKNKCYLKKVS